MFKTILVSSTTVLVIIGFLMTLNTILSNRKIKNQQKKIDDLITDIKPGVKILFGGGIIGTVVSKKNDFVMVQVDKDTILEVAVYGIVTIISDDNEE